MVVVRIVFGLSDVMIATSRSVKSFMIWLLLIWGFGLAAGLSETAVGFLPETAAE